MRIETNPIRRRIIALNVTDPTPKDLLESLADIYDVLISRLPDPIVMEKAEAMLFATAGIGPAREKTASEVHEEQQNALLARKQAECRHEWMRNERNGAFECCLCGAMGGV